MSDAFPARGACRNSAKLSYNPSRGEPLNAKERSQGIQHQLDF